MLRASNWVSASLFPILASTAAAQGVTLELSRNSNQAGGNDTSADGSLSDDGRFAVFTSIATNLVAGDNNGSSDIFLRDRRKLTTRRVSVDSNRVEGNGASSEATISGDGRYVAFSSVSTNLVGNDGNGRVDVFVHDRTTDVLVRVSVATGGGEGDGDSFQPALSETGRFVAFTSVATNFDAGDTNGAADIFVHDRDPDLNGNFDEGNGVTERVNLRTNGSQARNGHTVTPSISADGNFVAFASDATNLVAADVNGVRDIFLRDRAGATTVRVSVDSAGAEVALFSDRPTISGDGTKVAFDSLADTLVAGDTNATTDVFLRDTVAGVTTRLSRGSFGNEGNGPSTRPSFASGGRYVAFETLASNLIPGDTNGATDILLRDLQRNLTSRVSLTRKNAGSLGACLNAEINGDGSVAIFESGAFDLATGDSDFIQDVFARVTCSATSANYGSGLAGTLGIPSLTSTLPILDKTVTVTLGNSSGATTFAVLLVGLDEAQLPTAWGADILVDPQFVCPLMLPAAGTTFVGTLPDDDNLCGLLYHLQGLEFDDGAPEGVSFTAGLRLTLGL